MITVKNLALDVDGVLANFIEGVIDKAHEEGKGEAFPSGWRDWRYWEGSPMFKEIMRSQWGSVDFWSSLLPMPYTPRNIRPDIYLTARPIPSDVTEGWLKKHGFPEAPVVTVERPEQKIEILKDRGLWLVDDYYVTVEDAIKNGIKAYLFKAPYQRGYDLRHLPTITNLNEVVDLYEGKNTLRRVA